MSSMCDQLYTFKTGSKLENLDNIRVKKNQLDLVNGMAVRLHYIPIFLPALYLITSVESANA